MGNSRPQSDGGAGGDFLGERFPYLEGDFFQVDFLINYIILSLFEIMFLYVSYLRMMESK